VSKKFYTRQEGSRLIEKLLKNGRNVKKWKQESQQIIVPPRTSHCWLAKKEIGGCIPIYTSEAKKFHAVCTSQKKS
jgi:hypothetical protein